jgi:hypothetical protein
MSRTAPLPVRLAPVRGRALDGTPYLLPDELPGERTLVLIAFRQEHQRDVDRWIELAVRLGVPASPFGQALPMRTAVVEVPLLGRRWLATRRLIDGGMARGIGDPVVLARTITVYTDPVAFRRDCGLSAPGPGPRGRDDAGGGPGAQIEVLLADRDGRVTWAARGAPGPDAERALAAALADQPSGGGGGGGEPQPGPGSDPEAGPGR